MEVKYTRPIIAITGGLASGKSTFTKMLESIGDCTLICADKVAHQVLNPGTKTYAEIVKHFGFEILNQNISSNDGRYTDIEKENILSALDNILESNCDEESSLIINDTYLPEINRFELRRKCFGQENKEQLAKLEEITHSAILERCQEMFKEVDSEYILWDVPLLYEKKLYGYADQVISIECERMTQLQRALERDPTLTLKTASDILDAQATSKQRRSISNYVVLNDDNVTLEQLQSKAEAVNKLIMEGIVCEFQQIHKRVKHLVNTLKEKEVSDDELTYRVENLRKLLLKNSESRLNKKKKHQLNVPFEEIVQDNVVDYCVACTPCNK